MHMQDVRFVDSLDKLLHLLTNTALLKENAPLIAKPGPMIDFIEEMLMSSSDTLASNSAYLVSLLSQSGDDSILIFIDEGIEGSVSLLDTLISRLKLDDNKNITKYCKEAIANILNHQSTNHSFNTVIRLD